LPLARYNCGTRAEARPATEAVAFLIEGDSLMTTRRLIAMFAFALALIASLPTLQIDDPCPRGMICIQTN
jgi:hypothetical protein